MHTAYAYAVIERNWTRMDLRAEMLRCASNSGYAIELVTEDEESECDRAVVVSPAEKRALEIDISEDEYVNLQEKRKTTELDREETLLLKKYDFKQRAIRLLRIGNDWHRSPGRCKSLVFFVFRTRKYQSQRTGESQEVKKTLPRLYHLRMKTNRTCKNVKTGPSPQEQGIYPIQSLSNRRSLTYGDTAQA